MKKVALNNVHTVIAPRRLAVLIVAMVVTLPFVASAHDIPNDVTVQAFVRPEGNQLHLLVRVPMRAMRDVDFPKRGAGFIDLDRVDESLRDAATLWLSDNVEMYEGDARLHDPKLVSARVSLQSDQSFISYEDAYMHVTGARLSADTELYWEQAMLDALFDYPIQSAQSDFSLHPKFDQLGLRVVTIIRFLPSNGTVRAFELQGDPGLVRLDPRWHQAALRFIEDGFSHILTGLDHLLFLFCLVIPLRRIRPLVAVVTSFTVAHSVTLIASAYNVAPDALWFPSLIETLIAISILYMAIENIIGKGISRRWTIAFGFGLVHGFGFSFALRHTMQFAGSHMLTSLVSFNVGVELGQLLVLLLLIPVLKALFRYVVAERMGTIILSAFVAHTAWHWMIERADRLRQFPFPTLTPSTIASAMRWLMFVLIIASLLWLASVVLRRRRETQSESEIASREGFAVAGETELAMQAADNAQAD
ncbi:MAG TPA: HupE/UreJ family protein [Blastocatellia bacterium]|nr:HupE/UreJ family protein [Blastocatellia bacterium]